MRQIKFRGWAIQEKKFVFGDLITSGGMRFIFPDLYGFFEIAAKLILVDPETVGQYIGIADKEGNDIYEGDIVQWQSVFVHTDIPTPPKRGIIKWSTSSSSFYISYKFNGINYRKELDATSGGDEYSIDYIKVIDNVHETVTI